MARDRRRSVIWELNSSAQARWLTTVEVFNEQGDAQQLKLFPSHVAPPADDPQVARVLLNKVRLERTRQFGACFLGLDLWKRLELESDCPTGVTVSPFQPRRGAHPQEPRRRWD
jgi:hypothetical protein